jgi:hypothetical protein
VGLALLDEAELFVVVVMDPVGAYASMDGKSCASGGGASLVMRTSRVFLMRPIDSLLLEFGEFEFDAEIV